MRLKQRLTKSTHYKNFILNKTYGTSLNVVCWDLSIYLGSEQHSIGDGDFTRSESTSEQCFAGVTVMLQSNTSLKVAHNKYTM